MRREIFLRDSGRTREFFSKRSPCYAGILGGVVGSLNGEPPAWFDRLSRAWRDRAFSTYYEAPSLLLHQIHFYASTGRAPSLRAWFPSCGGGWGAGAEASVMGFLDAAPDSFWDELRAARLQTNEASRSVGWLLVGCAAFRLRGTPFHLVDLGTSAGLGLIGDYLPRLLSLRFADGGAAPAPPHWEEAPFPVLSRTGLDRDPVDLSEPRQRAWLKACLGPDNAEGPARFDRAADLFLRLRADPAGPRLERRSFAEAPEFASRRLRPHPEEGLLVYNSQAADFLSDEEYEELSRGILRLLAPWGDRGFWAELETPRDKKSEFHRLTVHRAIGGRLESRVLAELTAEPGTVVVHPGWDFLRPIKPVRPPRITREEPARTLPAGRYTFP